MDFDIYSFLDLDLMEQNLYILNLKSTADTLAITNYNPNCSSNNNYYQLLNQIRLLEELQDLQLQDAIYYDTWRDRWIIKEGVNND